MRMPTNFNNPSSEEVLRGEFEKWNLKFLTESRLWSWKITAEDIDEFFLYPVKGKHGRNVTNVREGIYVECSAINILRIIRLIQYIEVSQKIALIKYHDDKLIKAFENYQRRQIMY